MSTNRQVANLRKAFAKHLLANIKLSKTQLSKIIQSGGFLGRLLGPLLKTGLPLMKNVFPSLAKSILILPGLITAASAADSGIHKKVLGSGTTSLIISNKEMEDIMKIVNSLEDSGLLIKGASETLQNEAKERKGGFLGMLLGTFAASLLGNMLMENGVNKARDGIIRAGYGSKGSSKNKNF